MYASQSNLTYLKSKFGSCLGIGQRDCNSTENIQEIELIGRI